MTIASGGHTPSSQRNSSGTQLPSEAVYIRIDTGFPDGTYRPSGEVTRGQMATFLARALDLEPVEPPFSDAIGTTHAAAIGAVAQAEITGGFPDGTYRPSGEVTRGQMATFLARALGLI